MPPKKKTISPEPILPKVKQPKPCVKCHDKGKIAGGLICDVCNGTGRYVAPPKPVLAETDDN